MLTLNEMYKLQKENKLEVLTVNSAKALKGYAFIATIRDVEFAHRCCSNENLWNLAA